MPKPGNEQPPETIALYDKLVATNPKVERKGASLPYTAVNGNMFSYLHGSGKMALRLPKSAREEFLERYQTKLFEAYGIVQKEYVTVPDDLLGRTEELRHYFDMGFDYASGLKPKPSKKQTA